MTKFKIKGTEFTLHRASKRNGAQRPLAAPWCILGTLVVNPGCVRLGVMPLPPTVFS